MRPRCSFLLAFILVFCVTPAGAQGYAGGAFIVSRLPVGEGYVPGAVTVPANGLSNGGVFFGGMRLSEHIAVQGEASIPATLENVWVWNYGLEFVRDTTHHRDVIASVLMRVSAAPWLDLFAGGGFDFERTEVSSQTRPIEGPPGATVSYFSSATRAVFTTGLDLPIRVSRAVALLPTARMHLVNRQHAEVPNIGEPRPFAPTSKYVFRFGVGVRVEF